MIETIILLAALLNVAGADMRIGAYPADTDVEGWKVWMVDNCPTSRYSQELFAGFEDNMTFALELVPQSVILEECGSGSRACYNYRTDTIYLPDDGGAFLSACHELAHARGTLTHAASPPR